MEEIATIEQAEQTILQYSDFLSQAKLGQLYRLVDEYRKVQLDIGSEENMLEEGSPLGGMDIQIDSRDKRILQHIQQIIESS